ncbi:hypothetical protein ABZ800_10000 [Streptomyces sp. NPDC047813]|uniref:hypothetical protein n=1 Tax=Streptomyces sp. NPDC047813 TaxID=3154608 RepID=UPI0033FFD503
MTAPARGEGPVVNSAEPGLAADASHPLESARARMLRLTDRASRAGRPAEHGAA